jgi:hypothetical protein
MIRFIIRTLIVPSAFIAGGAAAIVAIHPDTPTQPTVEPVSPAEQMADQHGCWSRQAPADMTGKMPGHVVVTVEGRTIYSTAQVGPALEQVFEGADHGLTVHAFCR